MVKREIVNKLVGVGIAGMLILFIFMILIPPAASIDLTVGEPSPSSTTNGNTITFSDVNISIQNVERIPLIDLNFTIFTNANAEVDNVRFHINGSESEDTNSRFTVTLEYPSVSVLESWYTYGSGYDYGYGYRWDTPEGYGYGYGNTGEENITLSYTIVYTTHSTGTFYGKLFANATLNDITVIYSSSASSTFTVSTGGHGGTGGEGGGHPSQGVIITASQAAVDTVESLFGVTLTTPFSASDTNGDGLVDTFNDPNGVLTNVHFTLVNGSQCFLISTDNNAIPEFFWNTKTNTITPVSYAPGSVKDTYVDTTAEEVTVVVEVEKGAWVYIEIADAYPPDVYPEFTLTIKTIDGRVISPDNIWRQNDNIYLLDDPATQYHFVYKYDILPPTFEPPNGTIFNATFVPSDGATFNVARPSIAIIYFEVVTVTAATLNDVDILGQLNSLDQKTYTFAPTNDLTNGRYVLSITVEDSDGNVRTSTATYFVDLPQQEQPLQLPWMWIIIITAIIIIVLVIIILRKQLII